MVKVAVLDDWHNVARSYGDWDRLNERADVSFFADAFSSEDQAAATLADFDILLTSASSSIHIIGTMLCGSSLP